MTSERVQKALARAGVASRRQVENMIEAGLVRVNGEIIPMGFKVSPGDVVEVEGKRIKITSAESQDRQLLLYHKPEGEICSLRDERDRPTVYDALPKLSTGRWIIVGRLDYNTSGLLLFTTDGELANHLMHPSNEIEREYAVRVFGDVTPELINKLKTGVMLEDGLAHFHDVRPAKRYLHEGINQWYNVILREGRKREVRRLWESQGCRVSRLIRTRFGNITLPNDLAPGEYRLLSENTKV